MQILGLDSTSNNMDMSTSSATWHILFLLDICFFLGLYLGRYQILQICGFLFSLSSKVVLLQFQRPMFPLFFSLVLSILPVMFRLWFDTLLERCKKNSPSSSWMGLSSFSISLICWFAKLLTYLTQFHRVYNK